MTSLALLTAIFNSLWQAAALACLVRLALKRIQINAATRFVIWWAVLLIILVLPLTARFAPLWYGTPVASRFSLRRDNPPATRTYRLTASELPAMVTLPERPRAIWPLAILALWAAVLLYKVTRIVQSYFYLREVKRNAIVSDLTLTDTGRPARLLLSRDIASPMAVGFLQPAVLVPEDLIGRITPEEMDQILLHESAHLARLDDWSNLLGRLVGAVLALHPVVWWILRQIEFEREAACDDRVVARAGAVLPYAQTLAHMVELRWHERGVRRADEALASGVFGRGSRLGDRIEMLLQCGRQFSPRVSRTRVAAGCFALLCLVAAGSFAPRWIAFAKTSPSSRVVTPDTSAPAASTMTPLLRNSAGPPSALVAQATANPQNPQAAPTPAFEVTSVRATPGTTASDWIRPRVEDSQRFHARTPVEQLIRWAYGMRDFQILQVPDWLKREQFDVQATTDSPASEEQFPQMVQRLLADRFGLRVHRETRELPVYELVAGKNGARLTASDGDAVYCCGGEINIGRGDFIARGATMPLFVRILTDNLDRPVLDKTNLTGHYDFDINYEPGDGPAWTPIGAQLFTLVQDLGLRLEPQKDAVEMLVIDSVGHPFEN